MVWRMLSGNTAARNCRSSCCSLSPDDLLYPSGKPGDPVGPGDAVGPDDGIASGFAGGSGWESAGILAMTAAARTSAQPPRWRIDGISWTLQWVGRHCHE